MLLDLTPHTHRDMELRESRPISSTDNGSIYIMDQCWPRTWNIHGQLLKESSAYMRRLWASLKTVLKNGSICLLVHFLLDKTWTF